MTLGPMIPDGERLLQLTGRQYHPLSSVASRSLREVGVTQLLYVHTDVPALPNLTRFLLGSLAFCP